MQKKIIIGMVLVVMIIMIAIPKNAKAEDLSNDFSDCPPIPNILIEQCETLCVLKTSERGKEPNTYYMICGDGDLMIRWGDRCIVTHHNGEYDFQAEIWKVVDNEWVFGKNSYGAGNNAVEGFGLEYAPKIVYTNKDIYFQAQGSTALNPDGVWTFSGDYRGNIDIEEPSEEIIDKTLGLQNITVNGFDYNGIHYIWNSAKKAYMTENNLYDYLVFYDDYNKQLIFVWAFDDFIAQAKMQKSGLRYYSYYYEFITDTNNSSVLPYCFSVYQIYTDGTLECINSIQTEKADYNHQFSFGWTNPIYEPNLNNIDNFSTYEDYILENNLIASNCDIYNNSGVLVKSAVTLNNDLITPDEVPDTEIGSLKYYLYEKLPIIRTVEVFVKKFNVVLEAMKESGEPPEIIMNFDNYYGFGGEVNVLDVSWYEDYREPVKAILSAILIIPFILWVYKKGLPEAIGGI